MVMAMIISAESAKHIIDMFTNMNMVYHGKLDESELSQQEIDERANYLAPVDIFDELMSSVDVFNAMEEEDRVIYDVFAAAPLTTTMAEKNAYLTKLELETFSKIIMGQDPIDAFDTFVKDWKSAGGEKITKEMNEWYQASK